MIISRLSAALQFRIVMVRVFDASRIDRYTTFIAESSVGNSLRLFTALRITLFRDSMAMTLRTSAGYSNRAFRWCQ